MNSEKYRNAYGILSAASAGVVLTRTREPHRVLSSLQDYCSAKERVFRHWNFRDGWVTPNADPNQPPAVDGMTDPYAALRRICDLDGDGSQAWSNTVCVMVWPEIVIGQHPSFDECLRQYARSFPESPNRIRLVIATAEEYVLPAKLQHDIPILDFDLPSRDELRATYLDLAAGASSASEEQPFTEEEIESLTALGSGMTEAEFELACSKAIALKRSLWPNIELTHFAEVIAESKTEIVRRSEVLELMQPEDPNNIGGLQELKTWIGRRKSVFSDAAREAGVDCPRGIVLIGPPGTGKSMCAKAVAAELGVPLIKFDISRCFAGIVGQTEGRVRASLKQVEAMAPCVVFLDEVDKAGIDPRQAGGDSGVSKRVMGSILTFMQESKSPMFWILTANRPDSLPPELLRKGRMDEVFSVLPPNKEEREEIIRIHLRRRKQAMVKGPDLVTLVNASKGYVGAEIEAAIKEACVDAFVMGKKVTGKDIIRHLSCMKPISVAFKEDFDRMAAWAANNARPSSAKEEGSDKPTTRFAPKVLKRGRVLD